MKNRLTTVFNDLEQLALFSFEENLLLLVLADAILIFSNIFGLLSSLKRLSSFSLEEGMLIGISTLTFFGTPSPNIFFLLMPVGIMETSLSLVSSFFEHAFPSPSSITSSKMHSVKKNR